MPNAASQRTWGKDVSIHLNKRIGEKQVIIYTNNTGVFLGTMNPDGTNWKPKKIIDTEYLIRVVDVYNEEIYIYIDNLYVFDVDGNIVSLINMPTGLNADFFDFSNGKIYGWTKSINVPFSVSINSVNLNGTGYETHQITARTFSTYFYFRRLGNKLVYFYASSGRLYTATSDLDCTNFVGVDRIIRPTGIGYITSNASNAYVNFYITGVGWHLGILASGGNFTYLTQALSGQTYFQMVIKGSYLYQVTINFEGNVFVAKTDLDGNVLSEDEYILPEEPYEISVDPYDDGNIYSWTQQQLYNNGNIALRHLWTYPGNGPITPTTVQCQVTQTLTDASTGKQITLLGGV